MKWWFFFWSQNLKNQTWLNKIIKQHQLIHKAKKKHKKKKIEFDGKTTWVPVKNVLLKKYVEGLILFARSYSTNSAIAMNNFTAVLGLEINTKLSIWNTIVPKSFSSRSLQNWREALRSSLPNNNKYKKNLISYHVSKQCWKLTSRVSKTQVLRWNLSF